MDQAPMQTLAVSSERRLAGGFAPPGGQIPLALLPPEALLATLLDAPTRIVVLRVVGAALPRHLPLEPADGLGIGSQLGRDAPPGVGSPLRHDGKRGWT
jgi:hypothetical protein